MRRPNPTTPTKPINRRKPRQRDSATGSELMDAVALLPRKTMSYLAKQPTVPAVER